MSTLSRPRAFAALSLSALFLAAPLAGCSGSEPPATNNDTSPTFHKDVEPILRDKDEFRCFIIDPPASASSGSSR